jgi:hypothetical protein
MTGRHLGIALFVTTLALARPARAQGETTGTRTAPRRRTRGSSSTHPSCFTSRLIFVGVGPSFQLNLSGPDTNQIGIDSMIAGRF